MKKLMVRGGRRLEGEVKISGAKNAALPILAATLLAEGECVIKNVPYLTDVDNIIDILRPLGMFIERQEDGSILTRVEDDSCSTATYELVKKMRASVCVLGPLLATRKKARVSLPGGCVIGIRPIDLHLKGLRALGANIEVIHGYVEAEGEKLRGAEIFLGGAFGSTVLGTANVMMAATLIEGTTIIENAACEPEVQDLANFLRKMGAKIEGAGTHRLVIEGVEKLTGTTYSIIPDRIEAGTFIAASAITQGDILIKDMRIDHLHAVIDKFREIGVEIRKVRENPETGLHDVRARGGKSYQSCDVATLPYPGFPTDLQAQISTVLTLASGISVITEKVYPDRFMHMSELNRMGASVRKEGNTAIVLGVDFLSGAPVMASDLRASAALVLAGLVARGETVIDRIYHLERGYEKIADKFAKLGVEIKME